MLFCLRYGSLIGPASVVWRVFRASLTMASAMSSSLCGKAGVLQRKSVFSTSATVSVAVKNVGGEFFHPIGRVSGITTNYSSFPSKENTSTSLGESVGCKPMQ